MGKLSGNRGRADRKKKRMVLERDLARFSEETTRETIEILSSVGDFSEISEQDVHALLKEVESENA